MWLLRMEETRRVMAMPSLRMVGRSRVDDGGLKNAVSVAVSSSSVVMFEWSEWMISFEGRGEVGIDVAVAVAVAVAVGAAVGRLGSSIVISRRAIFGPWNANARNTEQPCSTYYVSKMV